MKQVLALLLLALPAVGAESVEVEQTPFRPWTAISFEEGFLPFDKSGICAEDSLAEVVHCSEDGNVAYYSTLDSDYAVFLRGLGFEIWGVQETYSFSDSSYQYKTTLADVVKHEFLKFQEWGIIDISADSAATLIDKMRKIMGGFNGIRYDYGRACDTGDGVWGLLADSSYMLCQGFPIYGGSSIPSELLELLPELATARALWTKSPGVWGFRRISSGTFLVTGAKSGMAYKLFSVNGVLLKSGRLESGGKIQTPTVPAVLKVDGGKAFWLK